MAKQNNIKSAANDVQGMFDPQNYQNVFKTWANMNERFTQVMVDACERSTEINTETAKETFSNLRDVAQVREEPAEYGQAYSNFMQKQVELFSRTVQSLAEVSQHTSKEAAELASETGSQISDMATENAERAADKAGSAAKKAA